MREYVHIGTGNYHAKTARLYTDFGLFTADPDIGADVAEMFNFLTGYGRPGSYRKVLVSPTTMRDRLIGEIEATVAAHQAGAEARIEGDSVRVASALLRTASTGLASISATCL